MYDGTIATCKLVNPYFINFFSLSLNHFSLNHFSLSLNYFSLFSSQPPSLSLHTHFVTVSLTISSLLDWHGDDAWSSACGGGDRPMVEVWRSACGGVEIGNGGFLVSVLCVW